MENHDPLLVDCDPVDGSVRLADAEQAWHNAARENVAKLTVKQTRERRNDES